MAPTGDGASACGAPHQLPTGGGCLEDYVPSVPPARRTGWEADLSGQCDECACRFLLCRTRCRGSRSGLRENSRPACRPDVLQALLALRYGVVSCPSEGEVALQGTLLSVGERRAALPPGVRLRKLPNEGICGIGQEVIQDKMKTCTR